MTRIVLAGINVFCNRGTEALALSNVQQLRKAIPDAEITVTTRDMEGARLSFADEPVTIVEDKAWAPPVDAPASKRLAFLAKRFIRRTLLKRLQPQEAALAEADLVVVSGGDTFSSDYDVMERYLRQLDQPIAAGIPVYFLAHSIGPFGSAAERASFTKTARSCRFSVREKISQAYLCDELGIDPAQVTLTADPAFLLEVPEQTRTHMLAQYGLTPGSYCAAVVSRSISGFTGITHEAHVAAWVKAARFLMEETGKLVLVPHVQMPEGHQDDLALAQEVAAALDHDPRCVVMDKALHSSVEFKAVLSRAVFVAAERTHGAIGAMSSGVPALSIGYSIKAEGVLRQLVTDEDLIAKTLIPAPDFTTGDTVAILRSAWEARAAFTAQLDTNLAAVKERAALNFEIARDLLP